MQQLLAQVLIQTEEKEVKGGYKGDMRQTSSISKISEDV